MAETPGSGTPTDEPFFRERAERTPGERRSLARASQLAEQLGLQLDHLHPLVVVGSKGKGTAASYAAATLYGAGASVGLITSPGYRSHHERIRYDGQSISAPELALLARRVATAIDALPPRADSSGYLSPTGAFTVAGLAWLRDRGCEALVVEAGMGGGSDESSLTAPAVVAITEIFEEHRGIIGDDLLAIAADKAAAVSPHTQAVLSVPQDPVVERVIEDMARRHRARFVLVPALAPELRPDLRGLPTTIMRRNADLGIRAAHAYLGVMRPATGIPAASEWRSPEVRLAGRLSVHQLGNQAWVLDSAISPKGVRAALAWCRETIGEPSTVLLSIPDSKDLQACLDALGDLQPSLVRSKASHLTFSGRGGRGLPPALEEIDHTRLGDLVLALGTISFVGEALDLLDVDLSRLF